MKRNQIWQSCLTSLLVVTLTASIVAAAPPEGKGGGKGGGGDDGGTTDPPAAPVDYHLETFFLEGFSPAIYDANDHGELLYTVKTSAVNQTTINSDAENSAALLNINTGQVQYIDNLLTREPFGANFAGESIQPFSNPIRSIIRVTLSEMYSSTSVESRNHQRPFC